MSDAKMSAMKVDGLYKSFGDIEVLKGVDMEIGRGQFYALMGRNGSGKATLASVMMCTSSPTRGQASIYGYYLVDEADEVKRLIGFVPQENISYSMLTGRENLIYFTRIFGFSKLEAEGLSEDLLKRMKT